MKGLLQLVPGAVLFPFFNGIFSPQVNIDGE